MAEAIIIFGSLTGNTEDCAEIVATRLKEHGVEVTMYDAMEADPEDFLDYDIILVGTYTFGNDAEIPDEMLDYYDVIPEMDLSGKAFGVFGSGDDFYPKFATAVDDFEEQFIKAGASKVGESIKVNISPNEEDIEGLNNLANALAGHFAE